MVLLFNHSDTDFEGESSSSRLMTETKTDDPRIVQPKDRIAQMILERISVPRLQQVDVSLALSIRFPRVRASD